MTDPIQAEQDCELGRCRICVTGGDCPLEDTAATRAAHTLRPLIYISGPITDTDLTVLATNLQWFTRTENELWRQGFAVINPASDWYAYMLGGINYEMCMERDDSLLYGLHAFRAMFPEAGGANWQRDHWQQSRGAVHEYKLSHELSIPCVEESEGVGRLREVCAG